jgi:ABC-type transporter Mla MlaB component
MDPVDPAPRAQVVLVVRGRDTLLGPVGPADGCDLALLDDLLRLRLAAARVGAAIRLTDVHRDLRELVDLVGLADRLGLAPEA